MIYKRCLCIEIGNYNTKIVQYRKLGPKEIVEKYQVFRTPENSIHDGKIIDLDSLAVIIQVKLNENSFKIKDVIFTISGTSIITREILLPKANEKELKAMIEMNASDYLPINLSNYILDFKVLREVAVEGGSQLRVLLVAVPNMIIEGFISLSEKCGLNILAIDYSGNSFYKAVQKEINWRREKKGIKVDSYAVFDIGSKTTSVIIVSEGFLEFSNMLQYGSKNMDIAISQRNGIDEDKAEELKIQKGNVSGSGNNTEELSFVGDSVRSVLITMTDDISNFFEYYLSRKTGNTIDMIFTTGCGSRLDGLEEYFQRAFGIPTQRLEKLNFVEIKESKNTNEFLNYNLEKCVGAAL